MALSPLPTRSQDATQQGPAMVAKDGKLVDATAAAGVGTKLGELDFLKLLTTQLKQQDPTKPMDDTQFVAQMAQFSSLQETQQLNQNFASFNKSMSDQLDLQTLTSSSDLIGKDVFAGPDAAHPYLGTVTEIRQQNGKIQVTIQLPDGSSKSFGLDEIQQVGVTKSEMDTYKPPTDGSSSGTAAATLPSGFSPYPAA